jgi:hypothetical protein
MSAGDRARVGKAAEPFLALLRLLVRGRCAEFAKDVELLVLGNQIGDVSGARPATSRATP